jgi:putative flippase GtrA
MFQRGGHPALQFLKYGFCGVVAALVHNGITAVLSLTLFPAGRGMMVDGAPIEESLRAYHLVLNNAIAWPFGTVVAYWLNVLFVFTPGRHGKWLEMILFWTISALGFFPGGLVAHWLVDKAGLPSTLAQLGFVFTSVTVNFICRKFIVFKG